MKKIIYTLVLAVFAWLTYMNLFSLALKILTAGILVKLIMSVIALILSFIVQKLMLVTAGSLILKDKIEELADTGTIYSQTTKLILILFIFFCLYRIENSYLLWLYASTVVLDNFAIYIWVEFVNKMNNT